jgi:SAM-dependent methyltransferase
VSGAGELWDPGYRAGDPGPWSAPLTDGLAAALAAAGARDVLELGCGAGWDAARFASAGLAVTALDASPSAVARTRERLAAAGLPGTALVHDLERALPFADGSFDAAVATLSLHYFTRAGTLAVLAEVRRVLRPGARLVAHVSATEDLERKRGSGETYEALEPGVFRAGNGQVRRFFSVPDAVEALSGWAAVRVEPVLLAVEGEATPKPVLRLEAVRP